MDPGTRGVAEGAREGLYEPSYEHDGCGIGLVANVRGQRAHALIEQGLAILANMEHRGAVGADPGSGDGAGIMIQVPHEYLRDAAGALRRPGFAPLVGRLRSGQLPGTG